MNNFNASSESGLRDVKQLKLLYKKMKMTTRNSLAKENRDKYLLHYADSSGNLDHNDEPTIEDLKQKRAYDKKEAHKTGGGSFVPHKLTGMGARILAIVDDAMTPLVNPYDSNATYQGDSIQENLRAFSPLRSCNKELGSSSPASAAASSTNLQERLESDSSSSRTPTAGPSTSEIRSPVFIAAISSNLQQEKLVGDSSSSPIPPGPSTSKVKTSNKITKGRTVTPRMKLEAIKRKYFITKLNLARFQLKSARVQHRLDMQIKREQLKNAIILN